MVRHFSGKTWWLDPEHYTDAPILDAIVTATRVAFDVSSNDYDYAVTLEPAPAGPAWWSGAWRTKTGDRGFASARQYDAVDGGIALFGTWKEDGSEFSWIVELRPKPAHPPPAKRTRGAK